MNKIINISKVIDNSGDSPVEFFSNPVETVIVKNPEVKEIPYRYNLCPPTCGCRTDCDIRSGEGVYVDVVLHLTPGGN